MIKLNEWAFFIYHLQARSRKHIGVRSSR